MMTCIDVELWAGSSRHCCNSNGSSAPVMMLMKTMITKVRVIAIVSGSVVCPLKKARSSPAVPSMMLNENAMMSSRMMN